MGSNAGLTADQIQLIKATVPVLAEHGNTITSVFYKNILAENPTLNNIFNIPNQVNGHQPRALAGALYAYAAHIDDLAALSSAVELICSKHASLYVQPEHYSVVAKYLLEAMGQVLDLMIARERQMYQQSEGWTNWREFKIADKVKESDEIASFYLAPADGKPLPSFRPGQYISVQVYVPELKYTQPRQYSLSDKPSPDYYRISVKKEAGIDTSDPSATAHPGYVSNLLHTFSRGYTVEVSHPYGDFFLPETEDNSSNPIVLISAGVGLTPLTSILNTLISSSTTRKMHFIHGAQTSSARAFKEHIFNVSKKHPSLQTTLFTSHPSSTDKEGEDYTFVGRVDLNKLDSEDLFLDNKTTEYYICGPEKFMTDMESSLKAQGVPASRIKMELFGTGGVAH